jgi:hypothetical protein
VRKLACALKAVASHRNPKFLLILFQMDMRYRSVCHENKICGVRHFSAVINRLGAVRLGAKKINSL